jgi:hypothetical protein
MFSSGGILQPLKVHQCYSKCGSGDCEFGEELCKCDGHYSGYDGEESNALCADLDLCEYMCNQLDNCVSIDKHRTLPRCFLNLASECELHEDNLMADDNYDLYIKTDNKNGDYRSRKLEAEKERKLTHDEGVTMPAEDFGFSWDQILRFKPLQFVSGGTFKLCFCDSSVLGKNSACSTEQDYKIEVGTIHASGVSCLIEKTMLQRVTCANQWHGGLRCYRHVGAPVLTPPEITLTNFGGDITAVEAAMQTKCLFMPEEQANKDPMCQAVSGFQSTVR